jgi:hypothetical protein
MHTRREGRAETKDRRGKKEERRLERKCVKGMGREREKGRLGRKKDKARLERKVGMEDRLEGKVGQIPSVSEF